MSVKYSIDKCERIEVRVSKETREKITELKEREGKTQTRLIDEALNLLFEKYEITE